MFVAAFTADLLLPGSTSRKDKRSVVRPIVAALAARGVSAAETGHLDLRARAEVGVAVVAPTAGRAREVLDGCERALRSRPEIEVVDVHRRLWKDSDEDTSELDTPEGEHAPWPEDEEPPDG